MWWLPPWRPGHPGTDGRLGHHHGKVQRVVVLGRGGAGKSTLAWRLGEVTGLPVVELDTLFWQAGLTAADPLNRLRADVWGGWFLLPLPSRLPSAQKAPAHLTI